MQKYEYILKLKDDALEHSGVVGQKKGIRRYQDYGHGGYISKSGGIFIGEKKTPKNNRRVMSESDISSAVERAVKTDKFDMDFLEKLDDTEINLSAEELAPKYERHLKEKTLRQADLLTEHGSLRDDPEYRKRAREACDLGLKVLAKDGRVDAEDVENDRNEFRNWFFYEDQTIGLATQADLVNRGFTEKDIENLINVAKHDKDFYLYHNVPGAFHLREGGDMWFVRECIKEKNKK